MDRWQAVLANPAHWRAGLCSEHPNWLSCPALAQEALPKPPCHLLPPAVLLLCCPDELPKELGWTPHFAHQWPRHEATHTRHHSSCPTWSDLTPLGTSRPIQGTSHNSSSSKTYHTASQCKLMLRGLKATGPLEVTGPVKLGCKQALLLQKSCHLGPMPILQAQD